MDIRRGRFRPNDPEYEQLPLFVKPGDWVIDIGANVGYYTWRLAHLVGQHGRVLAIEPMVNAGGYEVEIKDDGWTAVTKDGSLAAHFEHSVAVTKNGPYVLSQL